MSNAYDDFFKQAKAMKKSEEAAANTARRQKVPGRSTRKAASTTRSRRAKQQLPLKAIGGMFLGLFIALSGLVYVDDLDLILGKINIGAIPGAHAQAVDDEEAEKAKAKAEEAAKIAAQEKEREEKKKNSIKAWTDKDLSFLNKLSDRKAELDLREKGLKEVELELQRQRAVLDKKIKELNRVRTEISKILKDRIEMDDKKVGKLVDFYSNMKPQQAAQVFAEIDEDLAVEVLGRMKKKNAAAIMNLLKAEKAQVLSEKFAGYRKPAEE